MYTNSCGKSEADRYLAFNINDYAINSANKLNSIPKCIYVPDINIQCCKKIIFGTEKFS